MLNVLQRLTIILSVIFLSEDRQSVIQQTYYTHVVDFNSTDRLFLFNSIVSSNFTFFFSSDFNFQHQIYFPKKANDFTDQPTSSTKSLPLSLLRLNFHRQYDIFIDDTHEYRSVKIHTQLQSVYNKMINEEVI